MDWFQVDSSAPQNHKFQRLRRDLGLPLEHALGLVVALWCWCAAGRETGDLSGLSDQDIDHTVHHDGFAQAARRAGFIDGEEGLSRLHEWFERQPLARRRAKDAAYRHGDERPLYDHATTSPRNATEPRREEKRREQKKNNNTAAPSADAVSPAAPARRTDRLIALWQQRYGQRPTWGKGDYVQLARLDKALGEPEVDRRFAAYLEDGQEFYAGHPLKLFCSQADRFAVPTNGTTPNKLGRQAGGDQPRECHDARPDGPWAWLEPARDVLHAKTMLGMAEDAATRLGRLYGPVGWYYDCAWDAVKHWRAEVARLTPAEVR